MGRLVTGIITFMPMPAIRGIIDRRLLLNYRVDQNALRTLLPPPFRLQLFNAHGIAGICLIRLKGIAPRGFPGHAGLSSENAAHRIAVEWDAPDGRLRTGVYIPRRDTDSRLNTLVGGRLFPGVHHHARFTVRESDTRSDLLIESDDGQTRIEVAARTSPDFPASSVVPSLASASDFFEAGSLGFSARPDSATLDGLSLHCHQWSVTPLAVDHVRSSYFDDPARFPSGSARFDCALLMRDVPHEWRAEAASCCSAPAASA